MKTPLRDARDICNNKCMTTNECAHEGNLINQCANCIRSAFYAEYPNYASFEITDHDAMIISRAIDQFVNSRIDMRISIIDDDQICAMIDDHFSIMQPIIIEFMSILIDG